MLSWISPRQASTEDQGENAEGNDIMGEIMLGEVEAAVYEFQCEEEVRKSQVSLQSRVPDYSWLISADAPAKPRKFLSMQERSQIQRACELIRVAEWTQLSSMWKSRMMRGARSREGIIEAFVQSAQEIVSTRPRPPQPISSMLSRYLRSQSSINAVSDSPRSASYDGPLSTRSLGSISFRSIDDIV
ncbi:hypothetical protein PMAYCL1PPCAC_20371 [Pristionchus mayeri]|uniref:Rdl-1 n=1 Tax=Pristionchus mayeri TaxID=1317129 RepID=A0AAN5I452_9BILA|nr:hypothetical protein PMAYCL1PPCAC_20371 [Pristionchus mayeri]